MICVPKLANNPFLISPSLSLGTSILVGIIIIFIRMRYQLDWKSPSLDTHLLPLNLLYQMDYNTRSFNTDVSNCVSKTNWSQKGNSLSRLGIQFCFWTYKTSKQDIINIKQFLAFQLLKWKFIAICSRFLSCTVVKSADWKKTSVKSCEILRVKHSKLLNFFYEIVQECGYLKFVCFFTDIRFFQLSGILDPVLKSPSTFSLWIL